MARRQIRYQYEGRIITVKEISEQLYEMGLDRGAHESNLSRVFSGRHNPSYGLLQALAKLWQVDFQGVHDRIESFRQQNREWYVKDKHKGKRV
jgi:hypothetical protein